MQTKILRADETSLRLAKTYLEEGEVVAFHTETVYGLGANAFSDEAVLKIFALKGRPADNPLIVHVHRDYDLFSLIDGEPSYAEALRRAFLPGPLTMVYPSTRKVSRYVSCGLDTLAVRVPSSPTAQAFLKAADLPVAAPSANLSKHVSPVTAEHVYDDFCGKIPLILDGGTSSGGIESTVLDCTGPVPQILREGLVTREMIEAVAGSCLLYSPKEGEKPKSPGIAYKHYSPRCKTAYFSSECIEKALTYYKNQVVLGERPCFLLAGEEELSEGIPVLRLGKTPQEMAHNLYALLRRAEKEYSLLIAIEPKERGGVMGGVLNRLRRAFGEDRGGEHGTET